MAKSFRDKAEAKRAANPAMMFISQPESAPEVEETKAGDSPLQADPPMRAPQGREAKTRRLQLLLTPSLYEDVKDRAQAEGISVNELINVLLRSALRN